jgi:5-methyltetrahydrofolate--homocysteine methyltransferase
MAPEFPGSSAAGEWPCVLCGSLMTIDERLKSGPLLSDGAWGTQLQQLGLAPGECPDGWNLAHPDRVRSVAASYVDAGSAIVLTNTFRANRVALTAAGLGDRVADINREGVRISREAAAGRALVFASIGPTGKLVVTGEIKPEDALVAFREQAAALAEGGADALIAETMSDVEEASLALAAARETGLPVWVSFAFDSGKRKDRTMTGVTPEQAAQRVTAEGAAGVGANCGVGIVEAIPVCARFKAATSLPIWIKPNAGVPELQNGEVVYRYDADAFASRIPELIAAGAAVVGGCCGTNPDFIRAVARTLAQSCA